MQTFEKEEHRALWNKLSTFAIGGEPVLGHQESSGLTFSMRLARENRWERDFALRVIDEYRRFLFLAACTGSTGKGSTCTGSTEVGSAVTPSHCVDQAWHQHLVYTENYWVDLCQDTMGKPIHHGPTRGGHAQRLHYIDQYEQTLKSYEHFFGQPPRDIWPLPAERFRRSIATVQVDTGTHWVVPKPRFLDGRIRASHAAMSVGLIAMPAATTAAMFPFNLRGTTFLWVYAVLAMIAFAIVCVWIAIRDYQFEKESPALSSVVGQTLPSDMGWGYAAMIFGGKRRLVQTALFALKRRGLVESNEKGFRATPIDQVIAPSGEQTMPLELKRNDEAECNEKFDCEDIAAKRTMAAIIEGLRNSNQYEVLAKIRARAASATSQAKSELENAGYLRSPARVSEFKRIALGALIVIVVLGAARCIQGVANDRPIGFLLLELVAFVMIGWIAYQSIGTVTQKGKRSCLEYEYEFGLSNLARLPAKQRSGLAAIPYLAVLGVSAVAICLNDPTDAYAQDALFAEELRELKELRYERSSSSHSSSNDTLWDSTSWDWGSNDFGGDVGCGGGCGGCGGCGG